MVSGIKKKKTQATVIQKTDAQKQKMKEQQISNGISISLSGIIIVFFGLSLISICIALLPKIIAFAEGLFAKKTEDKSIVGASVNTESNSVSDDDADLMSAIGTVIHFELEAFGFADNQQITIRRDKGQSLWAASGKMRTLSTRR
ncbi:MAG: hypothetical protein ACI86H_002706 [bacterium]